MSYLVSWIHLVDKYSFCICFVFLVGSVRVERWKT
jgi:hypothetical protein